MRRFMCLMAGITLCFSSCDEPFDSAYRAYKEDPIALYLETLPEFSDWVAVLNKTGYFNSLNVTSMQTTHFVVKNGPLQEYARSQFGVDNILDVDTKTLQDIVKYHTIPNYKVSARNMNGKIPRRTGLRNYLTAVYIPGATKEEDLRYITNGDKAPSIIIQADIEVTNGYIHVLDTPLITEFKNLMEVLENYKDEEGNLVCSVFIEAVKLAGLEDYLRNGSVEVTLGPQKLKKIAPEEKTVFAVTDDAFSQYGITDVDGLKRYLDAEVGVSTDPSNPSSHFWQFVAYHIIPKSMSFSDLSSFPLHPAKADGTRLKRMMIYPYNTVRSLMKGLSVEDKPGGLMFNPQDATINNHFTIETRDIPAANGYVHIISNIGLKPKRMAYFPIEYEPTEEMPFRAIEFYQDDIAEGVAPNEFEIALGDVPTIDWTVLSADTRVWYSNIWMANDRFLNNDALYFTLGSVGNIDIGLPAMPITGNDMRYAPFAEKGVDKFIGGKYNVSINRGNLGARDFRTGPESEKWRHDDLRFGTEDPVTIRLKVGDFGGQAGIDRFILMPCFSGGSVVDSDVYPYYTAQEVYDRSR